MGVTASICRNDKNSGDEEAVEPEVVEEPEVNPLDNFNRKERGLLRDTWTQVDSAKTLIGEITREFIEINAELKPEFGVKLVPVATMLQYPKVGAHVKAVYDMFENITNTLGLMDNASGALQLLRKAGRMHARVAFLQTHTTDTARGQNDEEMQLETVRNESIVNHFTYFDQLARLFLAKMMPYFAEDISKKPKNDENDDDRKIRFAQSYKENDVMNTWNKFIDVCVNEIKMSFEAELIKTRNEQTLTVLVPQQRVEEDERRRKRVERNEQMTTNSSSQENKAPDEYELYEDPF